MPNPNRSLFLREFLGPENIKNHIASSTEYGSLAGVPIELGS